MYTKRPETRRRRRRSICLISIDWIVQIWKNNIREFFAKTNCFADKLLRKKWRPTADNICSNVNVAFKGKFSIDLNDHTRCGGLTRCTVFKLMGDTWSDIHYKCNEILFNKLGYIWQVYTPQNTNVEITQSLNWPVCTLWQQLLIIQAQNPAGCLLKSPCPSVGLPVLMEDLEKE